MLLAGFERDWVAAEDLLRASVFLVIERICRELLALLVFLVFLQCPHSPSQHLR